MSIRPDQLPKDPAELARLVIDQADRIEKLTEMLNGLRAMIFASRSERLGAVCEDQMALDLGDLSTDAAPEANDNTPPDRGRKERRNSGKAKRNIGALPAHLPRVEEVIDPAATSCACCGGALHRIG